MTAAPAVLDTYRCLRRNVLRTNWKGTRPKSEAAETADPRACLPGLLGGHDGVTLGRGW